MARDGVRHALVFATSAYGGYSACRQYHEDIARARKAVGEDAPELVRLRHFFDHPLFVAANADAVRAAFAQVGPGARLVFTAHSVPSGGGRGGRAARGGWAPVLAAGGRSGAARRGGGRGRGVRRGVAVALRAAAGAVAGPGHPRPPRRVARRGHACGGRRAGGVRVRPRRGGVGPGHRGPRAGRRAGHGLRPGGHGGPRPAVRGHGGRAGGRAHARRASPPVEHDPERGLHGERRPVRPRLLRHPPPPPR